MTVQTIRKLAEPKTLIAGALPVLLGSAYAYSRFRRFSLPYLLLLLAAIALIQSGTNMLNDYYDYRRGGDGAEQAEEKALADGSATPKQVLVLICLFAALALGIGVILALRTSFLILLVALAGGLVAFFYSSGPKPISYTPFGELASGCTMGFGITSTVVYIQSGRVSAQTLLMAVPTAIFIASILLTNNLCDLEKDAAAGRRTLPCRIGFEASKRLWVGACVSLPAAAALLTAAGVYPPPALISLLFLLYLPKLARIARFRPSQFRKREFMGLIGKLGAQFHLLLILGLLLQAFYLK